LNVEGKRLKKRVNGLNTDECEDQIAGLQKSKMETAFDLRRSMVK